MVKYEMIGSCGRFGVLGDSCRDHISLYGTIRGSGALAVNDSRHPGIHFFLGPLIGDIPQGDAYHVGYEEVVSIHIEGTPDPSVVERLNHANREGLVVGVQGLFNPKLKRGCHLGTIITKVVDITDEPDPVRLALA
ncbi:hypothetical protein J4447_04695 [Candidatus Pacearchaeota archaeon]|nr:hypothetical protein [Candidatus Pacearchaeota archaeon]